MKSVKLNQIINPIKKQISEVIMKKQKWFTILGVLVFSLILSQSLYGQLTQFQAPIYVTDGLLSDTIYFGLHSDATLYIDPALGEAELPPSPPGEGPFDTRFLSISGENIGKGSRKDFRSTTGGDQTIWKFFVKPTYEVPARSILISWPSDLNLTSGTLKMEFPAGEPEVFVNMLYTYEYEIPASEDLNAGLEIRIVRTETKPVIVVDPLSWAYGTVFIGSPVSKTFTIQNTGNGDLEISSITTTNTEYELSTTGPLTILPSESYDLTITLNPTTPGPKNATVTLKHNAGSWTTIITLTGTGGDPGSFRSFTHTELVTTTGGKLQKIIKRKPDKVEFELELTVPADGYNQLHFEGAAILPAFPHVVKKNGVTLTAGVDYTLAGAIDGKNKKFDYTFTDELENGDIINIHAYGAKGKQVKAKYWWLPAAKPVKNTVDVTSPLWKLNQPRLPMPTYGNVAAEIFPSSGIEIGTGKLKMLTYKDMWKTLWEKGNVHTGSPGALETFGGKPWVKLLKAAPPSKANNVLLANLVALKFNIAASQQGNTPNGFGELIYWNPGNELHGLTINQIVALADPKMTTKDDGFDYSNLNDVVAAINGSFSGDLDTVSFGTKLELTGTKTLSEVPFLRRSTLKAIAVPPPVAPEIPEAFVLYQNYPNPFNPTTTIEFNLPEDAIVSLKVYNMIGQEVATLIDNEEMMYGAESVTFDASNLSSGIYFYRLVAKGIETGATTQLMKKMVLMK